MQPYLPADPNIIDEKKIKDSLSGLLSKMASWACYYYAVEHGGFEASLKELLAPTLNTTASMIVLMIFTTIRQALSSELVEQVMMLPRKFVRVILPETGVTLVKKFDHEFPSRFSDELFNYLSMPSKEFPEASQMFDQPLMNLEAILLDSRPVRSPIYGTGKTTSGNSDMLSGGSP